MKWNKMLVVVYLIVFSGCAIWTPIKKDKNLWKYRDFQAEFPVGWAKSSHSNGVVLTYQGVYLQEISFSKARMNAEFKFSKRKITEDMLLQDISKLIIDELSLNQNLKNFTLLENSPTNLSGQEAFKIVYTFNNVDFVTYKCVTYGFVYEKKFYQMKYIAALQYHYDHFLKDFETMMESFKIVSE
ncbi:MAG: hypothetical protein KC713_03180 [Candidatus Omnitrophica bacterium]|nr:hypothetical protein [Candidatus Omnitrophota bacterium]